MVKRARTTLLLAACLLLGAVVPVLAQQAWPARPVKLIIPFAAGGNTDILGRIIAERLEKSVGATLVVENRPGAGANIGAEAAARSPGDGYTFFIGTASTHGINATLYKELRYDPVGDFEPVVLLARSALYLVVSTKTPVTSFEQLVAYVKANAGKVSYGSVGIGSPHHLAGETLKRRLGLDMTHVPYRGSAPALMDLIGGSIQVMFDATAFAMAKDGTLRVLAVARKNRWSVAPDVPTIAELGVADFEFDGWFGLFAPKGTPAAVVQRISSELNAALKEKAVVDKLHTIGLEPGGGTSSELKQFVASELVKWGEVVRSSGAKVE
ncbi:MAG: tripartite tricarboxylate transporter substrate binding protein [Variibacter sp.]|nr:tripartite tricarboxylate transporter substrate binding protein [Variibacter sp.]